MFLTFSSDFYKQGQQEQYLFQQERSLLLWFNSTSLLGFLTCIFIGSEKSIVKEIVLNEDIKPSQQAGLQVGALMVTIALAGLSGLISGFIVNSMICEKNEIYFVDSELFTEDENIPLPEWKYPRQNDFNLSSSGNKLDEQGREENNIEQN